MEESEELLRFNPNSLDLLDENSLRDMLSKNNLDTKGSREILLERFKTFLDNLEKVEVDKYESKGKISNLNIE